MDAFGFLFVGRSFLSLLLASLHSSTIYLLPAELHCISFTPLFILNSYSTMRFQFLMLLSAVAAVALAREDTAELCTGALSCDAGYCCSSQYGTSPSELLLQDWKTGDTTTNLVFLQFVVDFAGVQRCTALFQVDAIPRRAIAVLCKTLVFDVQLYPL